MDTTENTANDYSAISSRSKFLTLQHKTLSMFNGAKLLRQLEIDPVAKMAFSGVLDKLIGLERFLSDQHTESPELLVLRRCIDGWDLSHSYEKDLKLKPAVIAFHKHWLAHKEILPPHIGEIEEPADPLSEALKGTRQCIALDEDYSYLFLKEILFDVADAVDACYPDEKVLLRTCGKQITRLLSDHKEDLPSSSADASKTFTDLMGIIEKEVKTHVKKIPDPDVLTMALRRDLDACNEMFLEKDDACGTYLAYDPRFFSYSDKESASMLHDLALETFFGMADKLITRS